jgi:benzoate-CoA ligase
MSLPARFNFAEHLFALNRGRAQKAAYVDDRGTLPYGQLEERARRLAAALLAAGVKREDRVLLLMLDTADWPVSFLGCLYAGIVPVAVNTLLTSDDYAFMLNNSGATAALVSGALLPVLQDAQRKGSIELKTLLVSQPTGPLPPGAQEFEAALAAHAPLEEPAATTPQDHAFWLYSSGSTGKPKGTVHTHGNPWWTAELYGKPVLGLTENDVCFSAAKLYFAYGLGNALTFPLSVGATVLLMAERPTPDATFKRWTGEHKPTVFFGAPTGFAGMLASPNLPAREAVSLRMCSSAGEALPGELAQRFKQHFGCEMIDGIGSTEKLLIFNANRPGAIR